VKHSTSSLDQSKPTHYERPRRIIGAAVSCQSRVFPRQVTIYEHGGTLKSFRPAGLAFGPSGDLYIAEYQGNRVLRVREGPPQPAAPPVSGKAVDVAPVFGMVSMRVTPEAALAGGPAGDGQRAAADPSVLLHLTRARQIPTGP
jgi:hypothetical protein